MRIIAQNGLISVNFEECEVIIQDESIIYHSSLSKGLLGTYESYARAKEVFDDIHDAWVDDFTFSVYEMPEK